MRKLLATTTRAAPSATARHVTRRTRPPRSECHCAGGVPKRRRNQAP